MLILPDGLDVTRSEKKEAWLTNKCRAWLAKDERKSGLHASDLLDIRQAYFKRKYPEPLPDRLVTVFLLGKLAHAAVLSAVDEVPGIDFASDGGSIWSEELGVWYSPDKIIDGVPCELKTSRSFYEAKAVKDLANYAEQLMIYMAAMGSTVGEVWVLYMNLKDDTGATSPAWRVFPVKVTKEELDAYKRQLVEARRSLEQALETDEFQELPLCRTWKCGEKHCEYWKQCKPEGRYPLKTKTSWKA